MHIHEVAVGFKLQSAIYIRIVETFSMAISSLSEQLGSQASKEPLFWGMKSI